MKPARDNIRSDTDQHYYLKGILDNDRKVIKEIFDQYLPGIQKHIIQNGGTAEAAKDIFMDALEVVFRKLRTDGLNLSCSFYTYLFEIAKRLWLKQLRNKKSMKRVTSAPWLVSIEEDEPLRHITENEQYKLFRDKFQKLSPGCREILSLFLYERKSMQEITKLLNFGSEGYTRKRKHNCKEKLKKLIRNDKRYSSLKSDRL